MRILLIEDDHVLGAAIRDYLLSAGHAADWMQRIDDARHALAGVPYELVLLDLGLPDGRGLDLLRELHARRPDLPIVMITGYATAEVAVQALRCGAAGFLPKPFDDTELMNQVRQTLATRVAAGKECAS